MEISENGHRLSLRMASGNEERPPVPDGFTVCTVCQQAEEPLKLLSCLHSVCDQCLSTETDPATNLVQCSSCQCVTPLANIICNEFASAFSQSAEESQPEVHTCSCEADTEACAFCLECNNWVCDECIKAHQRFPALKSHTIKSEDEYVDELGAGINPSYQKTLYCQKHEREALKLYCETCDQLTCRDCQLLDHKLHDYQLASDIAINHRTSLREELCNIKKRCNRINDIVENMQKSVGNFQHQVQQADADIRLSASRLMASISNFAKSLLDQTESESNRILCEMNEVLEKTQEVYSNLDYSCKFIEQALEKGSDMAVLYSKKVIRDRLAYIAEYQKMTSSSQCFQWNINFKLRPGLMDRSSLKFGDVAFVPGSPESQAAATSQPDDQQGSTATAQNSTAGGSRVSSSSTVGFTIEAVPRVAPSALPVAISATNPNVINTHMSANEWFQKYGGYMKLLQAFRNLPESDMAKSKKLPLLEQFVTLMTNKYGPPPNIPSSPTNVPSQQRAQAELPRLLQNLSSAPRSGSPSPTSPGVSSTNPPVFNIANQNSSAGHPIMRTMQATSTSLPRIPPPYQGPLTVTVAPPTSTGQQQQPQRFSMTNSSLMMNPSPPTQPRQSPHSTISAPEPRQTSPQWHTPQPEGSRCLGGDDSPSHILNSPSPSNGQSNLLFSPTLAALDNIEVPQTPQRIRLKDESPSSSPCEFAATNGQASLEDSPMSNYSSTASTSQAAIRDCHVLIEDLNRSSLPAMNNDTEGKDDDDNDGSENDDWCAVCHDGGELLCCEHCERVYHLNCTVPELSKFPADDEQWRCLLCVPDEELKAGLTDKEKQMPKYKRSADDNITPALAKVCYRILLGIYELELSLPFHRPVNPLEWPAYYDIIKHPIDFSVVKRRLNHDDANAYTDIKEFVSDIRQVFRNCQLANEHDSTLYADSKTVEEVFENLLVRYLPDYAYDGDDPADDKSSQDENYVRQRKRKRVMHEPLLHVM